MDAEENQSANRSFSELTCHYMTGRSGIISGSGRNRVMGYRYGVMCDLGDLEQSDWKHRIADLIKESGEMELYKRLVSYVKVHYPWCRTVSEIELEALQLHAARIFENPNWVGYCQFHLEGTPQKPNKEREESAHECESKSNQTNAGADRTAPGCGCSLLPR